MSKKLREALTMLYDYHCSQAKHNHFAGVIPGYHDWDEVHEIVQQALAEEPEMIRLLRWLDAHYNLDTALTIRYIKKEFGYSLSKEEGNVSDSGGSPKA